MKNNNNDPDWASNGKQARRAGRLYKARSRLYQSQFLQVDTRWKALDEKLRESCCILGKSRQTLVEI